MALHFCRLSRAAVRNLQPGQHLGEHGILAEKLANGDVRWRVNVMVGGQRIHKVVGNESSGTTRSQAEECLEKIKTDARANRLGLPQDRKLTAPSFEKAALGYLKWLEENDGKNLGPKRRHLRNQLGPFFGDKRLDALVAFDIDRFKRDRRTAGAADATVNRELATLGHLLTTAVKLGWIDRVPVRLEHYKEKGGRITVLQDDDLQRLLQAAISGPDPELWLFIEIANATGMRHREILRIRWADCDFAHRRIFIPQAKAGARLQPITSKLSDILKREQLRRDDREGYIFKARHVRNAMPHIESFEKPFRRAVIAAGLDPAIVTPHVLRHTAITRLVQAGVDLPTVMRVSGHRTLAMVMKYSHISNAHVDEAIEALG